MALATTARLPGATPYSRRRCAPEAEHDPGQVVVAEHQRLLERAGRDAPLRAHLVHPVAADHRQEVVGEQTVAHGIRVDGDVRARLDLGDQPAMLLLRSRRLGAEAGVGERSAEDRKLLDQQDLEAVTCRLERRAHAGRPAADHDQIVKAVGLVVVACAALGFTLPSPAKLRMIGSQRFHAPFGR